MTIELTPRDVLCNLFCMYCYQHTMRDAGHNDAEKPYDFDKMFAALEQEGGDFTVFGGEPLLVPLPDLERIFAWGFQRYKKNGIQTNGVLITPAHIEAFKKYNVHVGFSIDGPGELNDSRWAGTTERTRECTEKSHANLRACIEARVSTSLILTLYKGNALPDKLPRLMAWIRELDEMGVGGLRVHILEVDHPAVREKMQLSVDQTIWAMKELATFERQLSKRVTLYKGPDRKDVEAKFNELRKEHRRCGWQNDDPEGKSYSVWTGGLTFDMLTDMRNLLRVQDRSVTCTWNPCDPYTTSAVRGIDGQGNKSNCGRTNKDGIKRLKAERQGYERQLALFHTPQEYGGCQGCRFFLMCKGQCPGTAIDGDWRNRTQDCATWMSMLAMLEEEMLEAGEMPLSLSPDRLRLEPAMIELWATGQTMSLQQALEKLNKGEKLVAVGQAGGNGHGDSPHGDDHGDHYDG